MDDEVVKKGYQINQAGIGISQYTPENDPIPTELEQSSTPEPEVPSDEEIEEKLPDDDSTGVEDDVIDTGESLVPTATPVADLEPEVEPTEEPDALPTLEPTTAPASFPDETPEVDDSEDIDVMPTASPSETPTSSPLGVSEVYTMIDGVLYDADGNVVDLSLLTTNYSSEEVVVYEDLEEFKASSVQVDLYQYMILEKLEFIQYSFAILICMTILGLFIRFKK